jgi:hypothetical protein
MIICKQLNYLRKNSTIYDSTEELLVDGEINGRNFSFIEKTYLKDQKYYGGKYQYILRIDISEFRESYKKLIYSDEYTHKQFSELLAIDHISYKKLNFYVRNQSPGIWENGFNPNYWLESKIGVYYDEIDRLKKIIETGYDIRDIDYLKLIIKDIFNKLDPVIKIFQNMAPADIPYNYWWGTEVPPPPRKPIF